MDSEFARWLEQVLVECERRFGRFRILCDDETSMKHSAIWSNGSARTLLYFNFRGSVLPFRVCPCVKKASRRNVVARELVS